MDGEVVDAAALGEDRHGEAGAGDRVVGSTGGEGDVAEGELRVADEGVGLTELGGCGGTGCFELLAGFIEAKGLPQGAAELYADGDGGGVVAVGGDRCAEVFDGAGVVAGVASRGGEAELDLGAEGIGAGVGLDPGAGIGEGLGRAVGLAGGGPGFACGGAADGRPRRGRRGRPGGRPPWRAIRPPSGWRPRRVRVSP